MPSSAQDLVDRLTALPIAVRLVFFTQTFGCETCLQARQVVDQIASLSDQVTVEEYNLVLDKAKVAEFGVDRAPAIAVLADKDLGLRYYGVPEGYETASLVDAVVLAAQGDLGLSPESLAAVAAVDRPVDIKVFVTPTCVYCPKVAGLAYRLAAASEHITASVIEATGFPELLQRYRVTGVPKTVVDGRIEILGVQPEDVFVKEALGSVPGREDTATRA